TENKLFLHLSAWIGIVPENDSTGGKVKQRGLSKKGDRCAHYSLTARFPLYSPTFRRSSSPFGMNFWLPWQPKCILWDAKQREDLALQLGELSVEDLQDLAVLHNLVPLGEAEQTQDLFRGRSRTVALLGVERQLGNVLTLHGKSQLALDDGRHEESEKIQGEERFDASLILEEDGSNFVHGLDLLEALLDHGLALVGLEHLGR